MRASARRLAGAAAVIVALSACGDGETAPTTSPERSAGGLATPDDGISRDEAEDLDVLTGDYDALLEGPTDVRTEDGCAMLTLELRNVGQVADRYDMTAEPATVTVDPSIVTLDAGDAAELSVRSCEGTLVVSAHSQGRGEVVAQLRR